MGLKGELGAFPPKVIKEVNCTLGWADGAASSKIVAHVRLKNTFIDRVTI